MDAAAGAAAAAAAVVVVATFTSGDGALIELSQAGLESEFAGGAAGGFAGGVGLEGVVVFVVGAAAAAAEVAASGRVVDLGLSPAEGDGALMSSTGLFVLFL